MNPLFVGHSPMVVEIIAAPGHSYAS